MKYVPSLPPVVKGGGEELDVHAMGRVKPVKAVALQSLSPIVGQPRVRSENYPFIEEPLERRHAPQALR
ncbi:MAG TPA: hypothetical protein VFW59_09105, partial [Gallionella sp.]|nr:hypothetical protein [Gallionella sp.]